jgi:hypothetical protein
MSADLERDMGHGTETEGGVGRGTGDGKKWEGEAPDKPKRQRVANSEWFSGGQRSYAAEKFRRIRDAPSSFFILP